MGANATKGSRYATPSSDHLMNTSHCTECLRKGALLWIVCVTAVFTQVWPYSTLSALPSVVPLSLAHPCLAQSCPSPSPWYCFLCLQALWDFLEGRKVPAIQLPPLEKHGAPRIFIASFIGPTSHQRNCTVQYCAVLQSTVLQCTVLCGVLSSCPLAVRRGAPGGRRRG